MPVTDRFPLLSLGRVWASSLARCCFVTAVVHAVAQPGAATAGDAGDWVAGMASAMAVFDACMTTQIDRYAVLCEPAETIARAVHSACSAEARELQIAIMSGVSLTDAETIMNSFREVRTNWIISQVLDRRLDHPCAQ